MVKQPAPNPELPFRVAALRRLALEPPALPEVVIIRWWHHFDDPALISLGGGIETCSAVLLNGIAVEDNGIVLTARSGVLPTSIPMADILDLDHQPAATFTPGDMFAFLADRHDR